MELFKGYVITRNKRAIDRFKNKAADELYSLEDVKSVPEYAGVLAEQTILVDIDDKAQSEIMYKIVKDMDLKCKVVRTTRGMHFYFKNSGVESCKTHTKVGIGLECDMKVGYKNSYAIVKYNGVERPVIHETQEIGLLPKWLHPINTTKNFFSMREGQGRNSELYSYILSLQSQGLQKEEIKACIRIINQYVFSEPLSDRELDGILRDEAFSKTVFWNDKQFLHDKFAKYLIDQHHIIRINGTVYAYYEGIYTSDSKLIERLMRQAFPSIKRNQKQEVADCLLDIVEDKTDIISDYHHLIAFKNGVYNLKNNQFVEFSPEYIITNKIPHDYVREAYSELADKTLNRWACNDREIRSLLEECIGYCFYRRNEIGKAFILVGDKSNGKSTFLDMVKRLIGYENTAALDLRELGDRFSTYLLQNKLVNAGDDIASMHIPDLSLFKKLVTGERCKIERKGQDPEFFENYSKMIFSANDIPTMNDNTGAVQRRLIIIPFNARFSNTDKDYNPNIKYELKEEIVMSYLINIGIDGLKRILTSKRFTMPKKVNTELEKYKYENDSVWAFLQDLTVDDVLNEASSHVYSQYSAFCWNEGHEPIGKIQFSKRITQQFCITTKQMRIDGKKYNVFVQQVPKTA